MVMSDIPIIGGPPKGYDNNYKNMAPEDQARIDKLFEQYPLKPAEQIDVSVSQEQIMKSFTGEDGKRVLTRMVVSLADEKATQTSVVNHFKRQIDEHCWELGYEVDYEFPGHFRCFKMKGKPFCWLIYIISKKNKYSSRDVYFGEEGLGLKEAAGQMQKAFSNIKKGQDFTKV
jgi:hypothetical protein